MYNPLENILIQSSTGVDRSHVSLSGDKLKVAPSCASSASCSHSILERQVPCGRPPRTGHGHGRTNFSFLARGELEQRELCTAKLRRIMNKDLNGFENNVPDSYPMDVWNNIGI